MGDIYEAYVRTLADPLKEYLIEARDSYLRSKGTQDEDYRTGYLMAFHRVVTLMQQQAEACNVPDDVLGLADIKEETFFSS